MKTDLNFSTKCSSQGLVLGRKKLETLQVNIGKLCNQACHHCHVEAGPKRTELMTKKTMDRILDLLKSSTISTVDITGGAPELNPCFKYFVSELHKLKIKIIDRCNLTVLFEPGQEETAEFLAHHKVSVVASLPCYTKENVERQRGNGVFDKSIRGLQKLNSLGYGKKYSLDLVYNPGGAFLPPPQQQLEKDYKLRLESDFGIVFNNLFTITNMPIKRFRKELDRDQKLEPYMRLLSDNFNPFAAEAVMCRSLISVGWDGKIYDCDFNQMLELPLKSREDIFSISSLNVINEGEIVFANHCFACTAGAGSSCSGSLA